MGCPLQPDIWLEGTDALLSPPSSPPHRHAAPTGVAAQGQGDVQEDDQVADGKDGQVLGCGPADLVLQGALWTHPPAR